MRALVTGGAGFIGSHLVDRLLDYGFRVIVFDNFSRGSYHNLKNSLGNPRLKIIEGDLLNIEQVSKALEDCQIVFHLAANPEVRGWLASPIDHFKQNIEATFNLLEVIRKRGTLNTFIFASSSTVYGEPETIPTPENYAPLKPISVYGASKLASEALISSYASLYGFKAVVYRLANIVGSRCNHGVIFDFIEKMKKNSKELEVLGNGSQTKSYLYIDDCIEGLITGMEKGTERVEIFNVGSDDQVNVLKIAEIVKEEMGLPDAVIRLGEEFEEGRGWAGDVKIMFLDSSRLKSLGWSPKYDSEEAVRKTVRNILNKD
ncbi:NAD-dependent epimerase/dehydratase family protein [Candidatus Bathyarchaeota archaeon]|nr:NAD-dependent epimerase/dehydratase family protein [Candidatus Bathyarchaeota archaeon]MBS7630305.1 NAD-dependent epimerase/dehydratase family protein [Candidatus Bathyarchaeota archaeon]